MKKNLLYILTICILHSILLYGKHLGINVILFTIPLLIVLFKFIKDNNLIKDKKGLLLMIPIIVLSITYFIYDNVFTYGLNKIVIPALYLLMYIYTIKPTDNLINLIVQMFMTAIKPLDKVSTFIKETISTIEGQLKIENDNKKKIKSIIVVIPIVILVLVLLSSADMVFENIFTSVFDIFKNVPIDNIIGRIIIGVLLFIYLGALMIYLSKSFPTEKEENRYIKMEEYTIKILLTTLNIIYVIFDIIQIHSLMLHHVGDNINYAEYARSGFFQLMFISILNIIIILIAKRNNKTKYNRNMELLMVGLTFIIIVSSFLRMHLYEMTYGYTVLRLGVYIILATEVLLFIPTIIYILKDKYPILKSYIVIIISVYTFINLFSIEDIITKNNINRYYETGKLDIDYLMNYNNDNIPQLVDLYNNVCTNKELKDSKRIKIDIEYYLSQEFMNNYSKTNSIFEYNISKQKAIEAIESITK